MRIETRQEWIKVIQHPPDSTKEFCLVTYTITCQERQGKVEQGKAGQGMARQGKAGQGRARQGKAWQGMARQGKAAQGRAEQVRAKYMLVEY